MATRIVFEGAHCLSVLARIQTGQEKYPALTGVRAVGAAVVFFDHFPFTADSHLTINVMAFFFALSGFLIVRIYYEQVELSRRWLSKYFVNRFARIYPVYFLLLTLAICLQHGARPWDLLSNYTLTHGLFHNARWIIYPSWSLTVEECFYALAPVLMVLARSRGVLVPLALGFVLLGAALAVSRFDIGLLQTPGFVLNSTFFGHFLEFFAGAYLALAVLRVERTGPLSLPGHKYTLGGLAAVSVLVLAMLVVYRRVPLDMRAIILINNFLIPLPIALLYWGLLRENTIVARFLATRTLGLLGRASYSFYLLHRLIIDYVGLPILAPTLGRPAGVLLTFVLTWLVAIALFLFYEEPVNLRLRRKFHSKERWVGVQATLFR